MFGNNHKHSEISGSRYQAVEGEHNPFGGIRTWCRAEGQREAVRFRHDNAAQHCYRRTATVMMHDHVLIRRLERAGKGNGVHVARRTACYYSD